MALKSVQQILAPSVGYESQYDDSRWRDRAARFRRKFGNFCQSCRRGDVPIQCHHVNYYPGRKLWEYDDQDLAMLCEPCHKSIHNIIRVFRVIAARSNASNLAAILGLLKMSLDAHGEVQTIETLSRLVQ
jgi:hypothetical protein